MLIDDLQYDAIPKGFKYSLIKNGFAGCEKINSNNSRLNSHSYESREDQKHGVVNEKTIAPKALQFYAQRHNAVQKLKRYIFEQKMTEDIRGEEKPVFQYLKEDLKEKGFLK